MNTEICEKKGRKKRGNRNDTELTGKQSNTETNKRRERKERQVELEEERWIEEK